MNQYQKLLYDIYGEYIESFGYKPTKNAWYKISSKGIASFIGTRLLYGGAMDFWISFQPIISPISNHLKLPGNCETPTGFGEIDITYYPLNGEDAFRIYPEITRKKLMEDSGFKATITQKIRGIMEEHLKKYFLIDMLLDDCAAFHKEFELMLIRKSGDHSQKNIAQGINPILIDIMLLQHQKYDVCLDYYQTLINRPLSTVILHQFEIQQERIAEVETEYLRTIYSTLCEQNNLAPMEYIDLFESMGMKLKLMFDEEAYCDKCMRIRNQYADIIALLKADDYDRVLGILAEKHERNAAIYREMKIHVPQFSSYFER